MCGEVQYGKGEEWEKCFSGIEGKRQYEARMNEKSQYGQKMNERGAPAGRAPALSRAKVLKR